MPDLHSTPVKFILKVLDERIAVVFLIIFEEFHLGHRRNHNNHPVVRLLEIKAFL
jgi:hypothetical protein